jgi:hypothetical protein
VLLVLAEGILPAGGQPLGDHFNVLEGGILVVIFINLRCQLGGFVLVFGDADEGEGLLAFFGDEGIYYIKHGNLSFLLEYTVIVAKLIAVSIYAFLLKGRKVWFDVYIE